MPDLMHHVTDIARCAALYRQEELASLGLKSCHASYLAAICERPGITQDQLARRIFINKSNVARQLVILEEDGFVERKPSPEDKRAIQVFPTEKAKEAMPEIVRIFRCWESFVAQDLSEEERKILVSMLEKMKARSADWMEKR
jgi:DNA-binding MarR family transcriptional regulator